MFRVTDNPLSDPVAANEGAVFLSVTHTGGNVTNWQMLHVVEMNNGRPGKEHLLRSENFRYDSHTSLFRGTLQAGTYRLKKFHSSYSSSEVEVGVSTTYPETRIEYEFDLGNDMTEYVFEVKAGVVNDLGRMLVGGPFPQLQSKGFVLEQTPSFTSNEPIIGFFAPNYLAGKTVNTNAWISKETRHDYAQIGPLIAHGYDAVARDAEGYIYTGNRMGAVLKIKGKPDAVGPNISLFNTGEINTIKSLLVSGKEVLAGGDIPVIYSIDTASKAIAPVSRRGLQTGSVEYLYRHGGSDLYAVICSRTHQVVQYCDNTKTCDWKTLRSVQRNSPLLGNPDRQICGAATVHKRLTTYVADEKGRVRLSSYDPDTGVWTDRVIDGEPDSVHVDYESRIVLQKDGVYKPGFIRISDDGGKTWRHIDHPGTLLPELAPVFVSDKEGYVLANTTSLGDAFKFTSMYSLLKTMDGGSTWTPTNYRHPVLLRPFSLPNDETLYARTLQRATASALLKVSDEGELTPLISNDVQAHRTSQ